MRVNTTLQSLTAAFACLALGAAVQVDPLPAPREITWGNSGAIGVAGRVQLKGTVSSVVQKGWSRTFSKINDLKWVPSATQAPIPSFQPFPTGLARAKRNLTVLTRVDVHIDDEAVELQHDIDESYTLDIKASSQSIS